MLRFICNRSLKVIVVLFMVTLLFVGVTSNSVSATPISCKWGTGTELLGSKTNPIVALGATEKDPGITIQCSPSQQWGTIRSQATYSNTNGQYVNYSNTGGYSRAKSHFDSMPGKVSTSNPNLKTTTDGTLTLYRSTKTSTNPWTLQYNVRGLTSIDKIRYYDGPIPIQSFYPFEVE